MCFLALVLPVSIVCYGIAKCIREITRGSKKCGYLMTNDLVYDQTIKVIFYYWKYSLLCFNFPLIYKKSLVLSYFFTNCLL